MNNIIQYDKLVRDKIPQIIEQSGLNADYRYLEEKEFFECLNAKLKEEVGEYIESGFIEELADIVEVINKLVEIKGYSKEEFDLIRKRKNKERGVFDKKIYLIRTYKKSTVK